MTNEELERAVERVGAMVLWLEGHDGAPAPYLAPRAAKDLRALLSERAELLAAVERMRGALGTKVLEAKINCNGSKVSVAYADGVIDTYNAARAALTTATEQGSSADWIKHDGGPNPVPDENVDFAAFEAYRVTEGVKP